MEGVSEANWSSFNATMAVEESEIMAQLLGAHAFPNQQDHDPSFGMASMFWPDHVAGSYYSTCQDFNSSFCYWPQESESNASVGSVSTGSNFFSVPCEFQTYCMSESNLAPEINSCVDPMGFCSMQESALAVPSNSMDDMGDSAVSPTELVGALGQKSQQKRKIDLTQAGHKTDYAATESPTKKSRASLQDQKSAKNPKSKKAQKSIARSGEEEEGNAATFNGQSSSCCSSEDDSNASQELNEGGSDTSPGSKEDAALNLNGKKRASRGSATDPQSLYARKRRERINERLRILQNLVPNGTKVDISTMLEEAVQYVKFLQLQIKLLSSDELWMYAPLAYNGMDIGLDLKISLPQQ